MRKFLKIFLIFLAVLIIVFLLGPRPDFPDFDANIQPLNIPLAKLDTYISEKESRIKNLREDNEARIFWANDSIQKKTEWSIVFLHGFSASPKEGDPIVWDLAKKYGMNAYFARLAGHGINDIESFKELTPKDLIESGKEALNIGKLIGEKVLVIGSSTGCPIATYLIAENPELADAIIFYSPNIDLHDKKSQIAVLPWGLEFLRKFYDGNYREISFRGEGANQYWTTKYRLEGIVAMRAMLNETMNNKLFENIKQPFMLAYWYKNEEECDKIISIPAALNMFDKIATPSNKKRKVALKTVDAHVLTSKFQTRNLDEVRQATFEFIDNVLMP